MIRGKSRHAFSAVAALSVLFSASPSFARHHKTAADYCNELQGKLNQSDQDAENLGYYNLSQPLVTAPSSKASTVAQAQALSNQKLGSYLGWLNQQQALLNSYENKVGNCQAYTDAKQSLDQGFVTYNNLKAYNGSYATAEVGVGSDSTKPTGTYALALPCRQDSQAPNGLRTCGEVVRDLTSSLSSTAPTGFFQNIVGAIYQGCDLNDTTGSVDGSTCKPVESKVKIEACQYLAPGFSELGAASPEHTKNAFGKSCGNWYSPTTNVSGGHCMVSGDQMGTLEQAFYQGNLIRAIDCHWAQVKHELASGKLQLSAPAGKNAADLYASQIQYVKNATNTLLNYKNIAAIEKCIDPNDPAAQNLPGQQSACQMVTHRKALESVVAHLAAKEVVARASRSFQRFAAGNSAKDFFGSFRDFLQQHANDDGSQPGGAVCRGSSSQCNTKDYMENCYKKLWDKFFTERTNSVWNSEVCQ